jgi:CheY-like chemotaxis protein
MEYKKMGFMGKRILLVDDEADIRALYKKLIEKGGYEVSVSRSGSEALEKIKTFKPHLIVLDHDAGDGRMGAGQKNPGKP